MNNLDLTHARERMDAAVAALDAQITTTIQTKTSQHSAGLMAIDAHKTAARLTLEDSGVSPMLAHGAVEVLFDGILGGINKLRVKGASGAVDAVATYGQNQRYYGSVVARALDYMAVTHKSRGIARAENEAGITRDNSMPRVKHETLAPLQTVETTRKGD